MNDWLKAENLAAEIRKSDFIENVQVLPVAYTEDGDSEQGVRYVLVIVWTWDAAEDAAMTDPTERIELRATEADAKELVELLTEWGEEGL